MPSATTARPTMPSGTAEGRVDLVIRHARLRPAARTANDVGDEPVDIAIADGRIVSVGAPVPADGETPELDAGGGLTLESFVDAHLHLDKVFTTTVIGDRALAHYHGDGMEGAASAIEAAAAVKLGQDPETMLAAGRRALALAAHHGTTSVRALADVDSKAQLRGGRGPVRPTGGARRRRRSAGRGVRPGRHRERTGHRRVAGSGHGAGSRRGRRHPLDRGRRGGHGHPL